MWAAWESPLSFSLFCVPTSFPLCTLPLPPDFLSCHWWANQEILCFKLLQVPSNEFVAFISISPSAPSHKPFLSFPSLPDCLIDASHTPGLFVDVIPNSIPMSKHSPNSLPPLDKNGIFVTLDLDFNNCESDFSHSTKSIWCHHRKQSCGTFQVLMKD